MKKVSDKSNAQLICIMLATSTMLLCATVSLLLPAKASAQTGPSEATPTPSPAATPKKKQTTSSTPPAERNAPPARTSRANASSHNANSGTHSASAAEIEFWDTIKNSMNPEDFRAYLKKYPNGEFADLAKNRLDSLTANTTAQPSGTRPSESTSNSSNAQTSAANPATVAGGTTWTLDLARSDLIESLRDVRSMEITEAHDTRKISVQIHTVFNRSVMPEHTQSYTANLDGSETRANLFTMTATGVVETPATIKAKVLEGGVIEFIIRREVNTQAGMTYDVTDTERWEFSADNKRLTVHRRRETPRGISEYDMVFNRR